MSYTYTRSFLTFLEQREYITLHVGGKKNYEFLNDRWVFIDREKSYATLLIKITLLFDAVVVDYKATSLSNIMILRDKNKKSKTFILDSVSRGLRDNLYNYNSFSLGSVVTCKETVYDVQMYKIHNINLFNGGRGFMRNGIQSLSSEDRKLIKIDEKDVCIFDYKGFEPSLCYTMCQEVYEGADHYFVDDMEGYDSKVLRNICKLSLLIMFNTQSRKAAHSAINEVLATEFDIPKLYKEGKIPYKALPCKTGT